MHKKTIYKNRHDALQMFYNMTVNIQENKSYRMWTNHWQTK